MAAMKLSLSVFMVAMVASMQFRSSVAQTRHVVGGAMGWTIPTGGAAAYTTWAARQTFKVGDTLVFNFTTNQHTVAEVSRAAYGPCTITNPISIATTGPASLNLTAAGPHYYICTVGTHCQIGQKLSINVSAAAAPTPAPVSPPTPTPTTAPVSPPTATPAPAPSTTTPPPTSPPTASPPAPPTSGPSPGGSTTPSPSGSTTPSPAGSTPPPPNSSASSFIALTPFTLLTIVLAFFY